MEADSKTTRGIIGEAESRTTLGLIRGLTSIVFRGIFGLVFGNTIATVGTEGYISPTTDTSGLIIITITTKEDNT